MRSLCWQAVILGIIMVPMGTEATHIIMGLDGIIIPIGTMIPFIIIRQQHDHRRLQSLGIGFLAAPDAQEIQ